MGLFDLNKLPDVYSSDWGISPSHATPDGPRASGPFGYLGTTHYKDDGTLTGLSGGLGMLSGQVGGGSRMDIASAQAHIGSWLDDEGKNNNGIEADAALARFSTEPGNGFGPLGFDVGAMTANAGFKHNDDVTSLGAQANLLEGAVTVGNKEHSGRVGLSAGLGAAARLHHSDADGDGIPELGLGIDAGPFSGDFKSEYLGMAWNGVKDAASSAQDLFDHWF